MFTTRRQYGRHLTAAAVIFSMSVLAATVAQAQGGRGMQLSPEERDKVWTAQAQGVVKELGVAEDVGAKVVDAYKASRTKHGDAVRAMAEDEGNRGPGMMAKLQELGNTEREALKQALGALLTAEQTEKAVASLGSYSWQWDRLVNVLLGLGLDAEKQAQALPLIAAYAGEVDAERAKAMQSGSSDWEALRAAGREKKEKLDAALAPLFTEEQKAKWTEGTASRGRGGFGGGGGAGRPAGGGAAPAGPAPEAGAPAADSAAPEAAAPAAEEGKRGSAQKREN